MNQLYVFILHNDVWIYIVASLGLLWYFNELIRGQRILRRAVFNLERERGSSIRNNALLFIILLSAVIGGVYYVNVNIAHTLPAALLRPPTPTPDIFRTPLASPTTLAVDTATPTPPLVPTITLAGEVVAPNIGASTAVPGTEEAVEETTPTAVPTPVVACSVQLNITDPRNGAVVVGTANFFGTANMNGMVTYRLEANGPQTQGQWASLLGRDVPQAVEDGFLGEANLSQWESGPYLIRLTAVDAAQNDIAQCVIQVTLEN